MVGDDAAVFCALEPFSEHPKKNRQHRIIMIFFVACIVQYVMPSLLVHENRIVVGLKSELPENLLVE